MWTPSPRLARAILSRLLPHDTRQDVLQFLDDQLETRAVAGRARARLWYWAQAFSFAARFSGERLRGLRHAVSSTDVKLALRMLVRYPGLTLVGTLGMAVGIAIAAGMLSMLGSPPAACAQISSNGRSPSGLVRSWR